MLVNNSPLINIKTATRLDRGEIEQGSCSLLSNQKICTKKRTQPRKRLSFGRNKNGPTYCEFEISVAQPPTLYITIP